MTVTLESQLPIPGAGFVARVPHARELGMHVIAAVPARVELALPFREDWLGDTARGLIHTGVITTLVDSACGLAVLARLGLPAGIATLDLRMDYLRPARRDLELRCAAGCYRLTTHIAFVRAEVWQDDPQQPVATSQSAFMIPPQPQGVRA